MNQRIEEFIKVREVCDISSILFLYSPEGTGVSIMGTLTLKDYHKSRPSLELEITDVYTKIEGNSVPVEEVKDNLIEHMQELSNIFIRHTIEEVKHKLSRYRSSKQFVNITQQKILQEDIIKKKNCPERFWEHCWRFYTDYLGFARLKIGSLFLSEEIDVCISGRDRVIPHLENQILVNETFYKVFQVENLKAETLNVFYHNV